MLSTMTIRVLFFGILAQRLGSKSLELEVPASATVGDAVVILEGRYPELVTWRTKLAFAVDMAYVKTGHQLDANDELALIPPVSGG